jgi:hypothetical protein
VDRHDVQPHTRVSIAFVTEDGPGEAVGWVTDNDSAVLSLRTRSGERLVPWSQVTNCRSVGVPRGRDPLRTPPSRMAELAEHADQSGRKFVIRLSQLLDGRSPVRPAEAVFVDGEWGVCAAGEDLLACAWGAAHADARNLLVVADDQQAEQLMALGFTEAAPAVG